MKTINKKNKRRVSWLRILDLLYLIAYPLMSMMILITIKKYTDKYLIIAAVVLLVVYVICLFTFFMKRNKAREAIRRILMIIICIALGFGYQYISTLSNSFSNITSNSATKNETVKFDVLALKGSNYNSINDITASSSVGYLSSNETGAKKVLEKMDKINESYLAIPYTDEDTMYSDFYAGNYDLLIFNEADKSTIPDNYKKLYSDTKTIYTLKYTKTNSYKGNDIDVTKDVFTVYISANDETGVPVNESLSDMNMLIIVNPNTNTITTVPIPRDSYVPNPAYDYQNDKLTHTGNNGITNTVKAVENMLQVNVDFYVKISFTSLMDIVNTLGGIDVNVGISFCEQNSERSFAASDEICLNAGEQTLNGEQALAYARHRHSYVNQDIGRNDAQLRIIKSIIKKMISTDGISKIDDVLNVASKYMITNFSDEQLSSFVKKQVDDMKGWTVNTLTLTNGANDSAITASGGDQELSIYLLSKSEIEKVNAAYNLSKNTPSLNNFKFKIDDLYSDYSTFKDKAQYQLVD